MGFLLMGPGAICSVFWGFCVKRGALSRGRRRLWESLLSFKCMAGFALRFLRPQASGLG